MSTERNEPEPKLWFGDTNTLDRPSSEEMKAFYADETPVGALEAS